jgi:O-antigen biosynthesis protein WbqP
MFIDSPTSAAALIERDHASHPGKRLFDLLVAVPALVIVTPVVVIALAAVLLEMRTSPLFRQRRVGKHMRIFNCYKIRTMRPGTQEVPTHVVPAAQVSFVGRFLRKTKIDELPQLLNVIKGDMSLVGPRPCLPSQTRLIELRHMRSIDALTPGITGMAQSVGIDMSDETKLVATEVAYLGPWKLGRDLRILLATFWRPLRNESAGA